jgi:hypothetical protein
MARQEEMYGEIIIRLERISKGCSHPGLTPAMTIHGEHRAPGSPRRYRDRFNRDEGFRRNTIAILSGKKEDGIWF